MITRATAKEIIEILDHVAEWMVLHHGADKHDIVTIYRNHRPIPEARADAASIAAFAQITRDGIDALLDGAAQRSLL